MGGDDRLTFIVEWYDPRAQFIRRYQFCYYPDNTVEMYDLRNHRIFLRRVKSDNVSLSDLYVGSTINILSRQLTFVDYGDEYTRNKVAMRTERTLGLIKPDVVSRAGEVLDVIFKSGFNVTRLKMCQLSRKEAEEFYQEHKSRDFFGKLVDFMSSGPVIALELMSENVVAKWRAALGPTDSGRARSEAPMCVRARFGTDNTRNAGHGSDSAISAARELEFFFPTNGLGPQNTASFRNSTCAVIKPHAVNSGMAGAIIQKISDQFSISAMQMFTMDRANAEEFYEIYKGVVQEYPDMVDELTAGPCIAMEIQSRQHGVNVPKSYREYCGPADPEVARQLRPTTLRALFGKTKVFNAVHCSDLEEDGLLEVEYFFKILDR